MLRVTVELPDLSRYAGAPERVAAVVEAQAFATQADVKASMIESPASGRVYMRGGIAHQASAPGEPPAVDLGNLLNSIATSQLSEYTWMVFAGAEYAVYLEYGTAHMAARPAMRPALERAREPFRQAVLAAVVA